MYVGNWCNVAEDKIDGLMQDCSNPNGNALELLQSCIKLSKYIFNPSMDKWLYRLKKWVEIVYPFPPIHHRASMVQPLKFVDW